MYEGLSEIIKKYADADKPLVLLLPVNGRDAARESVGIIGNMNENEAAELFRECKADIFIPMHHDLYPDNGVSNEKIEAAAEKIGVRSALRILAPGESLTI